MMQVKVYINAYQKRHFVGMLAQRDTLLFEYASSFLKTGIELSPFMLPLKTGIYEDTKQTFDGLFGLFNDSLPDGWGCLLLDRYLQKQGLSYYAINPLHRLSLIGTEAMGALEYEPTQTPEDKWLDILHLDALATGADNIIQGESSELLERLRRLNGSAAGARPKMVALVSDDYQRITSGRMAVDGYNPWIIKFSSKMDNPNLGALEYIYSIMAKQAGVDMPDTYLFPSKHSTGHFGVRRFDRDGKNKIHIHSACGLLHASHRIPTLDYENLIRLTAHLTQDMREVEKMVRLMIFNVKAGNRDDHTKNFSFMMTPEYRWKMTPAFDITPSAGINGEQTATVNGKGRFISDSDLLMVGKLGGVSEAKIKRMIDAVETALAEYPQLLKTYGIKNAPPLPKHEKR